MLHKLITHKVWQNVFVVTGSKEIVSFSGFRLSRVVFLSYLDYHYPKANLFFDISIWT